MYRYRDHEYERWSTGHGNVSPNVHGTGNTAARTHDFTVL